jgi:CheY-like chemotaxis protein
VQEGYSPRRSNYRSLAVKSVSAFPNSPGEINRAHTGRLSYERIIRGVMKKVLIAEGDETLRKIIEITLMNESLTVLFATNGQQVIELARSEVPDLIVAETRLPMISGPELKNNLGLYEDTAHIPVILLTAGGETEGESEEGAPGESMSSVVKPFSPMKFLAHIYMALKNSNNSEEKESSEMVDSDAISLDEDFPGINSVGDDAGSIEPGPEPNATDEDIPDSPDSGKDDE